MSNVSERGPCCKLTTFNQLCLLRENLFQLRNRVFTFLGTLSLQAFKFSSILAISCHFTDVCSEINELFHSLFVITSHCHLQRSQAFCIRDFNSFHPCFTSRSIMLLLFLSLQLADRCSGKNPSLSGILTSALFASNKLTGFSSPLMTAQCNGVCPSRS